MAKRSLVDVIGRGLTEAIALSKGEMKPGRVTQVIKAKDGTLKVRDITKD